MDGAGGEGEEEGGDGEEWDHGAERERAVRVSSEMELGVKERSESGVETSWRRVGGELEVAQVGGTTSRTKRAQR